MHFTASSDPVAIAEEGEIGNELPSKVFNEVRYLFSAISVIVVVTCFESIILPWLYIAIMSYSHFKKSNTWRLSEAFSSVVLKTNLCKPFHIVAR